MIEIPKTVKAQEIQAKYDDRVWRLNNLYYILDKYGKRVLFKMNFAQLWLYKHLHYMNVILKARQLGFSTFIEILILDSCIWSENKQCGIIAHTLDDAKNLLQTKIKFPYENLPSWIKEQVSTDTDSKTEMKWSNGSVTKVGSSLRGGTYNILHVSEYGEISHKWPDKAKEIVSGAFNTVQAGQMIFVESTHKGGKGGEFYNLCHKAMQLIDKEETELDFRFHFFPWFLDPGYTMDHDGVQFDHETKIYLDDLEKSADYKFSPGQRAWYQKKKNQQGYAVYQEFPSTADEAFKVEISGAFYAKQMGIAHIEGRITRVPHNPAVPVYTFWDLGLDCTAIWFVQFIGREIHCINYYENEDVDIHHYVKLLDKFEAKTDCIWGKDFVPHDATRRSMADDSTSVLKILRDHGRKVERIEVNICSIMTRIEITRQTIPLVFFDADNCDRGIDVLEAYHQGWNKSMNCWSGDPVHDWASHGSDSFGYMAVCIKHGMIGDNSVVTATEAETRRGRRFDTAIDDDYDPLYSS